MQWVFLTVLMKRIKALKSFMKDKKVPKRKKLIIVFGVLYLFTPIDLIPAPILGFGFLDDLTLWGFIIYYFKDELDKYWKEETITSEEKYKDKTIIEDAVFEEATEAEDEKKVE